MQKQRRNKILIKKNKKFVIRSIFRYRKLFKKNLSSLLNPTFLLLKKKYVSYFQVIIKITQNNVFFSFLDKEKIILTTSSGKEKIPVSKKRLRFATKIMLISFLKKISILAKRFVLIVKINAPLRMKILILRLLKKRFYKKGIPTIFFINPKKCFNGCKVAKKRRKKRKGLRIFK